MIKYNVIINITKPTKSEPESPIKTFLRLLKLKGRYAEITPVNDKQIINKNG